jgi:predicted nucleotidyltransferase component of viral defense system
MLHIWNICSVLESLLPGEGAEREWALREHLQRLVLYALAQLNLYERYTLQGGTALRLAHGSPRLSLDLDFTLEGAVAESLRHAEVLRGLLERALAPEGVGVGLSGSKLDEAGGFHRYFLAFDTRRLVGRKLRVKVEVLSRRYSHAYYEMKPVEVRYPVATAVGVRVKRLDCILADKVCSLAGAWRRGFVRWRDVFDIHWIRERGVRVHRGYLAEEFGSYVERPEDLAGVAAFLRGILERGDLAVVERELALLLHRSLLSRSLVETYLRSAVEVLEEAIEVLGGEAGRVG